MLTSIPKDVLTEVSKDRPAGLGDTGQVVEDGILRNSAESVMKDCSERYDRALAECAMRTNALKVASASAWPLTSQEFLRS